MPKKGEQLTVRHEKKQLEYIAEIAEKEEISKAEVVRIFVKKGIEKYNADELRMP